MEGDPVYYANAIAAARMICTACFIAWLLTLDKYVDWGNPFKRKRKGPWEK